MNVRILGALPLLGAVVFSSIATAAAGCRSLSAEEVGKELGSALLEIAKAFVRAGVWDDPPCQSPKTPELRRLCSLTDKVDAAVERVNKSVDRGCFDDKGPFAQSADFHAYGVLQDAKSSPDPRLRWQVLMRMYLLCRQGVMLTDSGSKECPVIIEQACIETLRSDADPFNRHLALEILLRGYATERSKPLLRELGQVAADSGGHCPRGFASRTDPNTRPVPWDEIARGYAASMYSCDRELAAEVLSLLEAERKSS